MSNFLDFINKKKEINEGKILLNEAFKNSDIDKAKEKILSILKKETGENIISLGDFEIQIGKENFTSELFTVVKSSNTICFTFNWLSTGNSTQVYSVSFYNNMAPFINGTGKADLTIETMGCSIVYFIPLISYVISTKDFNLSKNDATKFIKGIFGKNVNESASKYEFYIGALKYSILEGLSSRLVQETFRYNIENGVFENSYEDMIAWKKDKYETLKTALDNRKKSPENREIAKRLMDEYNVIKRAIKGGATSIDEVQLAIQKSLAVKVKGIDGSDKIEEEIEAAKKDPEQVFKEMNKYIKMVIKGLTPSVILCGAPGVGKTYRVKKLLKANGYNEDHNLCTIKGKCTPRVLYMKLLEFKNKGDIIVIDDADGLVGPKAPEDVINILKGALDSTSDDEGRLVCYGVSGILKDDEGMELPKKFYYQGSVIIITNYNAGQLDTALRGRSFIQDIHFSTEDVLNIIKNLLPNLDPTHLSDEAKNKAYDYLVELSESGQDMEISIRTFGICAKIFEACSDDNDFNDDDAKSMISEQMKLQSLRGGKKY